MAAATELGGVAPSLVSSRVNNPGGADIPGGADRRALIGAGNSSSNMIPGIFLLFAAAPLVFFNLIALLFVFFHMDRVNTLLIDNNFV